MAEKINPKQFRGEMEANLKQVLALATFLGGSEELEKAIASILEQVRKFEEEYGKDNKTG